jgi:hypothetical protein
MRCVLKKGQRRIAFLARVLGDGAFVLKFILKRKG